MPHKRIQLAFFLASLVGVFLVCLYIFFPYIPVLALAAILAFVMRSPYQRLSKYFRGYDSLAAVCTILITAILILLPLTLLGLQIFKEARDLYSNIVANRYTFTESLNRLISTYGQSFAPTLNLDLDTAVRQIVGWLISNLASVFSGTLQMIIDILLGGVAFFYFLKDGSMFVRSIIELSPLTDAYDRVVFSKLGSAVNSVIRGSLLVALIQGTLMGLGLYIFGVSNPTLWGSVAAVCSLIPGVGTSLVLLPAVIYLLATGKSPAAFGLLAWGMTAVGLIDNFLGPILIGRGVRIHPLLIMFSAIGGIGIFGPLGIVFGPLILSLFFALLDIYRLIILKRKA